MNPDEDTTEIEDSELRDPRVNPEPADEGNDVVDVEYHRIGITTDVQGDALHVGATTSRTDRVRRRLDWGDFRASGRPVSSEFVAWSNDDVVLAGKRDEEPKNNGEVYAREGISSR